MRRRQRFVAALLAALVASGCTATTGGAARPAPSTVARPLTGPTIKQALLDSAALSQLLDQPFKTVPPFPAHFGGSEQLGDRSGSPADCAGVAFMTSAGAYRSADVGNVATEAWAHDGHSVKVDLVVQGVVSLRTAAGAAALFARFSEQWKRCDGTTLTVPSDVYGRYGITDVRVTNSVLAATVSQAPGAGSILLSAPKARAVGIQGNCLVEVDVVFFGNSYPSDQGSADINTSAVDIAHAMMDKISALS
ncbi:sensor domain-containing protein [Mycobacterium sp. 1081908.1]|uniref:sensor domain-containing protein n=1 Tax=Mycobacterium sp. 1081908.1 TaxID=1834066 RepID=UPI0008000727|nr:sensor domain-containing protein [Mycobacterium sp. 1081908.1]OBK50252.1 hypothetical protein A5655_01410 [Mycobacterium sp. 1081908.1]